MIIQNTEIAPGDHAVVRIPIGRIPTGNQVSIRAHVFRSVIPGPTVLVLGGVHGDEVNGVEIVRQAVTSGVFSTVQKGSIIAIPMLNIFGFINFSRDVPDGKDVNRSFPGTLKGSLAARVARVLSKKIIPLIDFGVDFHTGGRFIYNYPQIRYTLGDAQALSLAHSFGAPLQVGKVPINKSLRKYAKEKGKPILVFEGGENLRLDQLSVAIGLDGIKRLLASQGMLNEVPAPTPTHHYLKSSWLRASRSGLFCCQKSAGQVVEKGETIGFIADPYGEDKFLVTASESGHIIGHSNLAVVNQGDGIFHIAHHSPS